MTMTETEQAVLAAAKSQKTAKVAGSETSGMTQSGDSRAWTSAGNVD